MGLDFLNLTATTLKNYLPTLVNNIMDSNAAIARMRERGNIILDGGSTIVCPIKYAKNGTIASFMGHDTLTITPQEQFTAAQYDWAAYNGAVVYSDEEIAKNSGKSRAINLIDAKIMAVEEDLMSKLNTDFFADGTGNGGKDMHGLKLLVADAPATGTVGGIDRATYTWWKNAQTATLGVWGSPTNQSGRADLDAMHLTTRRGKDMADMVVLGKHAFAGLKKEFQASELVNAEFKQIKGYGNIDMKYNNMDIIYDEMCDSGLTSACHAYVLNTKYLKLVINKNYNFKIIQAIRPTNQAAFVQHIRVFLQLITNNASKLGVVTGIA